MRVPIDEKDIFFSCIVHAHSSRPGMYASVQPQLFVISSVNFCPYPVDPAPVDSSVSTYPAAVKKPSTFPPVSPRIRPHRLPAQPCSTTSSEGILFSSESNFGGRISHRLHLRFPRPHRTRMSPARSSPAAARMDFILMWSVGKARSDPVRLRRSENFPPAIVRLVPLKTSVLTIRHLNENRGCYIGGPATIFFRCSAPAARRHHPHTPGLLRLVLRSEIDRLAITATQASSSFAAAAVKAPSQRGFSIYSALPVVESITRPAGLDSYSGVQLRDDTR